jgi:hypothetical protein
MCAAAEKSFAVWLRTLDASVLDRVTVNHDAFRLAEKEWYDKRPSVKLSGMSKRRILQLSRLDHRIAVGLDFKKWCTQQDKHWSKQLKAEVIRSKHVLYARAKWAYIEVPKNVRVWVSRCEEAVGEASANQAGILPSGRLAKAGGATRGRTTLRRRGKQGRPVKAAAIREELFEWFVSLKAAVAGRFPPKLLMVKARSMCSELLTEMKRTGQYIALPKIDKHWLRRWKLEYGVCLRKPNRKYKVSLNVCRGRLRSMWLSCIRIRALARCVFSRDLTIEGIDQKGIHMNECGSKNTPTLCLKGAPDVALKENHAATRQRVSLMTTVTSDETRAARPGGPPLEVMFKGETKRILKDVEVPDGVNMHPP